FFFTSACESSMTVTSRTMPADACTTDPESDECAAAAADANNQRNSAAPDPNIDELPQPNEAPSDISLDNSDIDENTTANTVIGVFSTTDLDTTDTHTYS